MHLRVAIFYFDNRPVGGWGRPEAAEFDGSHPLTSSLLDIPRTLCFFLSATKVVFWSLAVELIRTFFFLSTLDEANGVPSQCLFVGFPSLWKWLNCSGDGDQEKPQWREKEKSQISFSLSKKSDGCINVTARYRIVCT